MEISPPPFGRKHTYSKAFRKNIIHLESIPRFAIENIYLTKRIWRFNLMK